MKRLFITIGLLLIGILNLSAQTSPFGFQSNSNLKVYINQNIISPQTWINWNSTLPISFRITDYYQELKIQNDLSIANPTGNGFFNTSYWPTTVGANPFISYQRDSSFIWHYAKFFFNGISDIGIDSGIVLSTGKTFYIGSLVGQPASYNAGPGNVPGISQKAQYISTGKNLGITSWIGEPNALQIPRKQQYPELVALNNGRAIADANIFEFDVQPYGNFISLDYVFASEEWPLNSCDSGADVMAIMLSGPGIVGEKNIAVLPGTQTPVTTKTVYPPGLACKGPEGSPWYVDNTGGQNVIYNGFTKVLRAASIVQPCQTYHVKVMVAEGVQHPYDSILRATVIGNFNQTDTVLSNSTSGWSDGLLLYDSGIFLKMGSLRSTDTVQLEALGGLSLSPAYPFAMRGCFNGKFRLSVSDSLPVARTFTLNYSGSALSGVDYQALPSTVTLPAFAKSVLVPVTVLNNGQTNNRQLVVKVQSPYGTCLPGYKQYLDTAILNIVSQYPVAVNPDDTLICVGCQVQLQTEVEPGINYTYAWSPGLGLSNTSIGNPIAAPNVSTAYTVTVTGNNGFSNCAVGSATAQVNIGNVGIKDQEIDKESLKIYPNATKDGKVQISVTNGNATSVYSMSIFTAEGKLSEQKSGTLLELNVYLSSKTFSSGSYRMILQDKAGQRFLGNFVVL